MSDMNLSPAETRDFRLIAGIMIPASEAFGVPGADDATIFADIVKSVGRDIAHVKTALARLSSLAGGAFAEQSEAKRDAAAQAFLEQDSPEVVTLGRTILQGYYRDDRVVRSLGLEPRPPFPKGHTLEQGDWSLLDPVKKRPKMWRDAP